MNFSDYTRVFNIPRYSYNNMIIIVIVIILEFLFAPFVHKCETTKIKLTENVKIRIFKRKLFNCRSPILISVHGEV